MYLSKALGALALGMLFPYRPISMANFLTASSVVAQNQTYCASDNVCYAVNVPETTASSGSGDLYFHMSGPSTMSWIGFGQGESMTGSNIFLIYANAAGTNVTLSPRMGVGERPPSTDSAANLTLLEGSGISNAMMVANVRCEFSQSQYLALTNKISRLQLQQLVRRLHEFHGRRIKMDLGLQKRITHLVR
jgi:hypothetical protein